MVSGESAAILGDKYVIQTFAWLTNIFNILVRSAFHSAVLTDSATTFGFVVLKGEVKKR